MIDILERDGDCVLWRYKGINGCSWIWDDQVFNTEVCDSDFMLTADCTRKLTRAVKDWLEETGEGAKWLEETLNRRRQ